MICLKEVPSKRTVYTHKIHISEDINSSLRILKFSTRLGVIFADYTCSLYKLQLKSAQTSAEVSRTYTTNKNFIAPVLKLYFPFSFYQKSSC